ncbi:dihydropteroate synthase [Kushneria indalinina]|uniref:Dihydropteroate synthase n=1 Tax=Kushneria indalinina DSM 14324 TaxID=1122140 RepID=A0A3D9DS29_9GAMM|nr:dihydropteroate synthase [Kushneria indalinina]REC93455.1 dihydropteroate synthase [Kushneria indalinina DSM 14324]
MSNASTYMTCGERHQLALDRPHVMGILNVTPDSFSDGGQHAVGDAALRRAEEMLREGADIIDVGGESTRPGATPVGVQEEMDRVAPIVERLAGELGALVSVDTSAPEVMTAITAAGAGMINDVRSLRRPGALEAAAESGLPVCLMHMVGEPDNMQNDPQYERPIEEEVATFLDQQLARCRDAGIAAERLLVDPGFGFAKTLAHNLRLMNRLEYLQRLGYPLLVGTSRKGMIGRALSRKVDERLHGGLALTALAVSKGAWIIRTHDVAASADAVGMTCAVLKEGK